MPDSEADRIIRDAADRSKRLASERSAKPVGPSVRKAVAGMKIVTAQEDAGYQEWLEARKRAERVAECHRLSNIPEYFRQARFGDTSKIPADVLEPYTIATGRLAVAQRNPGIYALCGEVGDGKTHMACGLVNWFCEAGRSAKYMKCRDYISGLRSTWKMDIAGAENAYEARHVRFSLLVLDEWQVRGETENENTILLGLIDKRYDAGGTTLLISNHANKQDFQETIDVRIVDRMHDGGGIIMCEWPSLRGRIARAS